MDIYCLSEVESRGILCLFTHYISEKYRHTTKINHLMYMCKNKKA
jgi:hypothetical protein